MSYFIRSGNTFNQTSNKAVDIYNELPVGTYTIKFNEMTGQFYYELVDDFEVPTKTYGDLTKDTNRIINTFNDRKASTGVLLSGEKGSGKTLLAKNMSVELLKVGIPTIVINTPWFGEGFNTFVQTMEQPAMFIFDEFEKVYDEEAQEKLLTLLDGVYPTKKLFVLTSNDQWRIDKHMRNRPGRIYYMIEFNGLGVEFVEQYASENLLDKSRVDSVVNVSGLFKNFNFDMLKAVVEEMNRYNETAQDAIKILNTKPASDENQKFDVVLTKDGVVVEQQRNTSAWTGNPLQGGSTYIVDPEDEEEYVAISFRSDELISMDAKIGKFVFNNGEYVIGLTRQPRKEFDYTYLLK